MRGIISSVSSKSDYGYTSPTKIIDGSFDHSTYTEFNQICFHSSQSFGEWWKATFRERVAIVKVHFYNRQDGSSQRSNNLLIIAVTTTNGVTTEKLCANTGTMENVPDKMFYCETPGTPADEVKVMNQINNYMNFCELIIYGWVL